MALSSGIEKIGVELIVKGKQAFNKDVLLANKHLETLQDTVDKFSRLPGIPAGIQDFFGGLDGATGNFRDLLDLGKKAFPDSIGRMVAQADAVAEGLTGMGEAGTAAAGGLSTATVAAGATAVAIAALSVAAYKIGSFMFDLGKHGSEIRGIAEGFDQISTVAGMTSRVLLTQLRVAARGTVDDLSLMTQANRSLAGSTGEVAQQMGQSLPRLMEIARVQSRLTGESVQFLFESITTGVRKGEPELLDNAGLVVKASEAYERYAAIVGGTADSLTAEQKQLAVLNEVLRQGQTSLDLYGNSALTARDRLAQIRAMTTNLFNDLSLAIQPTFDVVTEFGQLFISSIITPIREYAIPLIYEWNKVIQSFFAPILKVANQALEETGGILEYLRAEILPYVIIGFRVLGKVVGWVGEWFANAFKGALKVAKKFVELLFGQQLTPRQFFEGGARTIGALANGILKAANDYVFPAAIFIARGIADLLVGMSPPPKGPLKDIDKGGENVMLAWLDGFVGANMQPVEGVAQWVNDQLGAIGGFDKSMVEGRIAALDQALLPFQDRLDIIKARAEAITEPFKGLYGLLEKKLKKSLDALFKGSTTADSVRAIDRQMEAINNRLSSEQDSVDMADFQLQAMQAMQGEERALLAIRMRSFGALQEQAAAAKEVVDTIKETGAASEDAAAKGKKEGGGGGGKAEQAAAGGGGLNLPEPTGDPLGSLLGVDEAQINAAISGITGAFQDGFNNGAELGRASSNLAQLRGEVNRIKGSSGFSKIKGAIDTVFGDGEGSIKGTINTFRKDFDQTWNSIFGEEGIIAKVNFSLLHNNFLGTFGEAGVLRTNMTDFIQGFLQPNWDVAFGEAGFVNSTNFATLLGTFSTTFATEGAGLRFSLFSFFDFLEKKWPTIFDEGGLIPLTNFDTLKETFQTMFGISGVGQETVTSLFDLMDGIFKNDPSGRMYSLLSSMGSLFQTLMVTPLAIAGNAVIQVFEDIFNTIIRGINSLVGGGAFGTAASLAGYDLSLFDEVSFGRIPAGRRGGLFGGGMVQLHKDELVYPTAGQQLAVFPQNISRAIMGALEAPAVMPQTMRGGDTYNSTDNSRTINATFNTQGTQHTRLRLAQLRAIG